MSTFKPMLAATVSNIYTLELPLLVSYKLDGIRATVRDGIVYSRSNKPIPNLHVQKLFGGYEHLDGELILGDPTAKDAFKRTTSAVMSKDGEPDVYFHAFDHTEYPLRGYIDRIKLIPTGPNLAMVSQVYATSYSDILDCEGLALEAGYEGIILRSVSAPYKFGRSTLRSQGMIKLKRFTDAEAEIVGVTEMMHNNNQSYTDETGHTKRSTAKDGLEGTDLLGAFICVTKHGVEFSVGTGLTMDERSYYWRYKEDYIGSLLKYKYFDIGDYDVPRHPVFLGIRDSLDV